MTAARPGTVYLVGAGPGDPGLLTVRGRDLLEDCDAIVHDALAAPELLQYRAEGRAAPEIHYAGKRGGDARSTAQSEINTLLIELARAGKSVVRLKGGDPFVFGRGGEEAEALAAAKVPFEIVPGVTAGIAGPAYAGIPVTHRGVATAVTFVTGHEDPSKSVPQTDWKALAAARGTLVLYMGVARLDGIARELLSAGLPADTPAAAIERATTPSQRVIEATISTIAERVKGAGLSAPVLTVIGAVVGLRDAIRWYDDAAARPLLGHRVLITRGTPSPSRLTAPLQALGAIVREIPAVRVERLSLDPLAEALRRLREFRHVIFTSQTAVEIVWSALRAGGRDARALAELTISAVGPATATALLEHGIGVDVIPARYVAEGLLDAMRARADVRGERVLYPSAAGSRDVLPHGLRALGAIVDVVPIYQSVPDTDGVREIATAVQSQSVDLVILTSASAARAYAEAVGPDRVGRVPAASIGPVTTAAARAAGVSVRIEASESTLPALVDAIARSMRNGAVLDAAMATGHTRSGGAERGGRHAVKSPRPPR